ncbi:unnamed protein product [Microthlaspi erraticum]|uniref:Uncharacterized protein n=1 Tax=Microthlaspi erraticum TaxID=1685480 RepID=A0A6D2JQI3_9BRAS|nr:unnamed protein product [Microthlaspi erraticum]
MTSPFELIKVRKQVAAASGAPNGTAVAEAASVSPMITKLLRRYTLEIKSLTQTSQPHVRVSMNDDWNRKPTISHGSAASHSFDTARIRAQCVILPKYTAKERKFLKWNNPGKRLERWKGIHHTDRNLGIGK